VHSTASIKTKQIVDARVIAVPNLGVSLKCISCKQGDIEPIAETAYGKCTQCPTTVLVDVCKTFVSALLTISSETFQIKLMATDDQFYHRTSST
jgi:hypothetical protein